MSTEMFTTRNRRGRKRVDDTLHRPMLNNEIADKEAQTRSARLARAYGLSNDTIKKLYPLAN